jgi:DNA recombination protein RmuC
MEILIGLIGLVLGLIIGYLITKGQHNKSIGELQTNLNNEKNLHVQTKEVLSNTQLSLQKIGSDFQNEQKERVKFETQLIETNKYLNSQKEDLTLTKDQLSKINQSIVAAESLKTKAETELKDANNSIVDLNKQITKHLNEITSLQNQLTEVKTTNADISAKYQESLKAIEEQKRFVTEANTALKEAFSSLSSDALRSNNQSFLDLAKTALEKHVNESKTDLDKRQQAIDSMVKPLSESLNKFDGKIQEIEKARQGAYSEIKVFLDGVKGTTEKLQKETNSLVTALKTSHVRGKYGEIGLKRIVEFAGMSEFCDFDEQSSVTTEDGRLRPDLIVKLPGQRRVIVDAKVPLSSYMQAFETIDETERKQLIEKHALAVREHLKKLSAKSYWSQFDDSPDYVIMYLQIESSFGATLEIDRTLIEDGMNNNVIFATPTTLITMLRTIAFSWQQVSIAKNIYQIRDAGIELYNRVTTLIQHISAVGTNLNSATQNYNKVVGSLENRFVPQVKKLKEIGGTLMDKDIPELAAIETLIRPMSELTETNEVNSQEPNN